jgi:hypothetical protein
MSQRRSEGHTNIEALVGLAGKDRWRFALTRWSGHPVKPPMLPAPNQDCKLTRFSVKKLSEALLRSIMFASLTFAMLNSDRNELLLGTLTTPEAAANVAKPAFVTHRHFNTYLYLTISPQSR